MAESVTYADLRFVKAPLKKRISSHLGQDSEADDDGELTYENVQVPPISGGASNLASSGPGDKAGLQYEPPTASWSPVTSPAARRLLVCRSAFSKYLLGLLLTCLLLGMAAVSLGVRYLQVSQQLQHMNRLLEATNSSLRQQLRLKITQLGQREQDLQGSRKELAQSRETLEVEQRDSQAVKEQLQACQSDSKATKETLQREEEQRRTLEERLSSMRDTLKPFFTGQEGAVTFVQSENYIQPFEGNREADVAPCENIVKTNNVARFHTFGHHPWIVLIFFPASVRGKFLSVQISTELNTHASKSLCPSSLTCSHGSCDDLPPAFPHSAGMVPGQGLM